MAGLVLGSCPVAGQPVDAVDVLLPPVGFKIFGTLALGPLVEHVSMGHEIHERDAVAAGVGDPGNVQADDGPGPGVRRKGLCQRGITRLVTVGDLAATMQAHDAGRSLEGTEHDDHPPVFLQVSNGLGPAAGEVEVGGLKVAQDAQGVATLG